MSDDPSSAHPPPRLELPSRRAGKRRDRHGRGLRGPLLPRTVPGWRSRTASFDDAVADAVTRLDVLLGDRLAGVEFAVEDVPPSVPAPWEHNEIALARYFPAEAGQTDRIVVYRRPVVARSGSPAQLHLLLQRVLTEQIAHVIGLPPQDIDPEY